MLTLLATTGVSLLLGFGYWNIAARLFSQEAVGYGSAAISAMTLLSSFGTFGLNTLLVGDLPKRAQRAGLISAAMLAAAMGSLLLAVGFVLIVPHITSHFDDVARSLGGAAVFCVGVALSATSIVFDAATIGMLRGGLQFTRNMAFVLTKILTLVGAALALHYTLGIGLFASWVAAIPVALLVVAVRLRVAGASILPRPDWKILKSLGRALAAHNWLNLSLQGPALLIPVVAASILQPSTNAAYYVAVMILSGLFILPAHMSTVLFALGSADPQTLHRKLRFGLRVTVLVGVAGMVIISLGAHFILGIFGSGYARVAVLPMRIMILAYLPGIPNFFYISVARATNKISQAARLVTSFAVLNVAGVVVGGLKGGLVGMAIGDVAVVTLEALVTTPVVIRAARGLGRHRRAAPAEAKSSAPAPRHLQGQERPLDRDLLWGGAADRERRQLAALSVLMLLSTPTTATMMTIPGDSDEGSRRAPKSQPSAVREGHPTI